VDSIDDVRLTFDDLCEFGTAAQCRSYFVVLTLHGYETHAIFDYDKQRSFMYMDYVSLLGRGILDILTICLSEAAVHRKNPKTVPIYVHTLGNTSYSKTGQNERKQKSLCTNDHWDTDLSSLLGVWCTPTWIKNS
jgi:hypothetical protein